ncbi:hypothetical protein Tco_1545046, partial [Tanacetum coccineum]
MCESSHLPNVAHVLPCIDNAAKDEDSKCWPAYYRITRRGTGERVGRGGRGRRPREEGINRNIEGANGGAPDFSTIIAQQLQNLLPTMLAQENFGNVIVNGNRVGCLYKEFLACNPKKYDGKGGVVVLTCWIKKMKSVHDMSGCSIDEKLKYTAGSFVGKALTCHAAYTDRFHELARLVPHLVTPESRMIERYVYGLSPQIRRMVAATKPKTIQKAVQISGALTNKAVRNGSIKKVEKRGSLENLARIGVEGMIIRGL